MTDSTKTTDIHAASNAVIAKAMAATTPASKHAAGVIKQTNPAKQIDPKAITRRAGWNPRFDFGEIEGLATSIKANGVLNAIRVKRLTTPTAEGHVFELIDGDRRLTAVELILKKNADAFPEGIPAIVVDKGQDDLTSLIQMFEANSGKVFLPLEEAAAYKRMKDAGLTLKDIEKATGRSDNSIVGALALLDSDEDLIDAVKTGKIKKGLGKSIAVNARGDKAKQKELTKAAIAAGNDKTKRRAVVKAVDDSRRAKAAKIGKVLKIRALSDAALSDIGAKIAERLATVLGEVGMNLDSDLANWIKEDKGGELKAAFLFGALEALKAAAGAPSKIDL